MKNPIVITMLSKNRFVVLHLTDRVSRSCRSRHGGSTSPSD